MRWIAIAAVIACAGCHGSGGGWGRYNECKEERAPGAAATVNTPQPAHADFAKLRAFRNYYSLDRVGAYEHHFAVWFQCIEPSVTYYAIAPDDTVRNAGGMWGGLAVRDGDPDPVPEDQQDRARLVTAQHDREYDGASSVRVQYLGSYREIVVGEVVPDDPPGDPYARGVWHMTATLRGTEDLSGYDGSGSLEGGYTRMCWKDTLYRDCGQPHWIDFAPSRLQGTPQLAALVSPDSPQTAAELTRFEEAVAAAARARVAGEEGVAIDTILEHQGDGLLPDGFAPPAQFGFTIYARGGKGLEQESHSVAVDLSPADLVRSSATGSAEIAIAGVTFTLEVEAWLVDPLPADAAGEVKRDVRIQYTLRDNRRNEKTGEVKAPATLWVDGDAVAFRFLAAPDEINSHQFDAPFAQVFPGAQGHASIDFFVAIAPRSNPWYP